MQLKRQYPICFIGAWLDACASWRLWYPHLNMPGSSFAIFNQKFDFDVVGGNDVVVVQRCSTQPQLEFIKACSHLEMKIIYDLDDLVWDLPMANPAYPILTAYKNGFNACIRMVDAVTVSTKSLAKGVMHHVKHMVHMTTGKPIPIFVVENRMDTRLFCKPQKADEFIVGWAGSTSHFEDLTLVQHAIHDIAIERPDIQFEIRGGIPPYEAGHGITENDIKVWTDIQKLHNYRFKTWVPVSEFGFRMPMWGWQIALAPVTDVPFNAAKSCIKMMEAAWCKIPCLASWVDPYYQFVQHDKELKWLLCVDKAAWGRKLRTLINEPAMREDLGNRMYEVLINHYTWNRPHEGWETVLQAVGL